MISKEKMIEDAKIINSLLDSNKLYNSRLIYKLLKDKNMYKEKSLILKILTYARELDIINYDREYVNNITYWKKTQ